MLFDTGAALSYIPRHEADALGLNLQPLVERAYALGGATTVYSALLKQLKVAEFTRTGVEVQVTGDRDTSYPFSMVLGDDFFSNFDVEFDLSHGAVRLFRPPQGCTPPELVYWGAAYSQAPLLDWNRDAPAIQAMASINGKPILATLDSGASMTSIDAVAAAAAGVHPQSGAAPDLTVRGGGAGLTPAWAGRFDSFALGDEKISNVVLQVMNLNGAFSYTETGSIIPRRLNSASTMLIGEDFLHAHRVFIDVKDHLILFSYEGGPVFAQPPPPK